MADLTGYVIVRGAVSQRKVEDVAGAIEAGLTPTAVRDKYTEFEVPAIAYTVGEEFLKTSRSALVDFAPVVAPDKPKSINIGTFHSTNPDPSRPKTAFKGQVYVTIALTDLNSETGWFVFLEGSHRQTPESTKPSEWRKAYLNLSAGDAVIWRGDLAYLHSSGGGGGNSRL